LSSSHKSAVPEPSEIAGRYQIVKKLGAGAFGTVYKAKDKILGRMVAIKTIRLEGLAAAGASLEELMERFKREAQVSAQLKHPNIVTIYDVGEANGVSYLAMEFIDGVGLEKVISSTGRLPVERAGSIGAQIADALDFAHKNGVVHRDIKPANIMIESGDRVKVTDFGIAKVTTGEHLTMTGSLLGTPSYMSPEQARGSELDGRSDLFAVGAILYEMLAGQKAFRGDSITALIFKIITEEPPPIQALDPSIPDVVIRIIAKALSKAPETRYQSGRELADDLLALTRPGSTPTVRLSETPTARSVPGTAASLPTVSSPPTVGAASPTRIAPTLQAPPPIPAAPQARASSARPGAPAAAVAGPRPKARSNAGLILVFAFAFLAFATVAGVAGWYLFLRKPAEIASASPSPALEPPATTTPAVTTPPASMADATMPATPPAATLAPTTLPPATTPPARVADAGRRDVRPPQRQPPVTPPDGGERAMTQASPDEQFIDEEPPAVDGAEAGQRLADAYSSNRSRSTPFGAGARFPQRERSPRNLAPVERPAVAAMRHVMNAQDVYQRKNGRYGSFSELTRSQSLLLDVPVQERAFMRKGYRFELSVETDGYKVLATPVTPGPRPFVGDDSGFIRAGIE
jgi:serine/threonine-protein kinase